MLMHQGLGLATFNALPYRKAVHALYECCGSVAWSSRVAQGRPYLSYEDVFAAADTELAALSDSDVDSVVSTLHEVSRRGKLEDLDADTRSGLDNACRVYSERFGYRYVVDRQSLPDDGDARAVLMDLGHRLDNDTVTERAVMRRELAKINRTRIERLLGPEEGWPEY